MWWLYLDESGDLGFDFVNKNPSEFFTICILATSHRSANVAFRRAVRRTLHNKINRRKGRKCPVEELKGADTRIAIKRYAWRMVKDETFGIYSITLNKRRVFERLASNKARVYNYIARQVVDRIPFERARGHVQLIVDRSKGKKAVWEFNDYIQRHLQARVEPGLALDFTHDDSKMWPGLQWADLFAWGVFQRYERGNDEWYREFRDKVRLDEQFL